jgi:hypothetical protein
MCWRFPEGMGGPLYYCGRQNVRSIGGRWVGRWAAGAAALRAGAPLIMQRRRPACCLAASRSPLRSCCATHITTGSSYYEVGHRGVKSDGY